MRKLFLLFALICFSVFTQAQTTARLYLKFDRAIENSKPRKAERILNKIAAREAENFLTLLKTAQLMAEKNLPC